MSLAPLARPHVAARALLPLALAALTGCAGAYAYHLDPADADGRQRLTERAARHDVVVRLQGEPGVPARALSVRADSVTWRDPATGAARSAGMDRLWSITFPGSDGSPLKTLALSVGGGVLAGAAVGALVYDLPHGPIDSRGDAAAFGAVGTGLIAGLTSGWVVSDRRKDDLFLVRQRPAAEAAPPAGGADGRDAVRE